MFWMAVLLLLLLDLLRHGLAQFKPILRRDYAGIFPTGSLILSEFSKQVKASNESWAQNVFLPSPWIIDMLQKLQYKKYPALVHFPTPTWIFRNLKKDSSTSSTVWLLFIEDLRLQKSMLVYSLDQQYIWKGLKSCIPSAHPTTAFVRGSLWHCTATDPPGPINEESWNVR